MFMPWTMDSSHLALHTKVRRKEMGEIKMNEYVMHVRQVIACFFFIFDCLLPTHKGIMVYESVQILHEIFTI